MNTQNLKMTDINKNNLLGDLKMVVADTEELLKATVSQTGEKITTVREKIGESLRKAKYRLSCAEEAIIEKTRRAAKATDEYVHDNPWRAVGGAAGVGVSIGLVIGLLIGRR